MRSITLLIKTDSKRRKLLSKTRKCMNWENKYLKENFKNSDFGGILPWFLDFFRYTVDIADATFSTYYCHIMALSDKVNNDVSITSDPTLTLPEQDQAVYDALPDADKTHRLEIAKNNAKQYARQTTLAIMTALSPLVPSASTVGIATGAGMVAASTMSCEKDDPSAINRSTDNPANKAEFMKDVKSAVLGGGIATMEYDAVWVKNGYQLQPKSIVDFAKAAAKLEEYAKASKRELGTLAFAIIYRWWSARLWWSIPYADLLEIKWINNLNSADFSTYLIISDLTIGSPNSTVSKNTQWFLGIRILDVFDYTVLQDIQSINPHYFWN